MIRERRVPRPEGLAAIVFSDPDALAALEGITGPVIKERVALLRRAVPDDVVSVFDMPLLVERGMWVHEHLTVVVEADARPGSLGSSSSGVSPRPTSATGSRPRPPMPSAASWRTSSLTTVGRPATWLRRSTHCGGTGCCPTRPTSSRAGGLVVPAGRVEPSEPSAQWSGGARVVAKLAAALVHEPVTEVEHIGSTSVPGLAAKDVIDVQVGVRSLEAADVESFRSAMRAAGYVESVDNVSDNPHPAGADAAGWAKRFYGGCDPVEFVHVHVRENGSAGWRFALLFRNWLRANPSEREAYAAEKRRLADLHPTTSDYAAAKEAWFSGAYDRATRLGATMSVREATGIPDGWGCHAW